MSFRVTWPELTPRDADRLVTMYGGVQYNLVRKFATESSYEVTRGGRYWTSVTLPKTTAVVDFLVMDRYIFIATETPAMLYMAYNVPMAEWSSLLYTEREVTHVSIGNYHNNPLIIYTTSTGAVWAQVLVNDNPFMRMEQQMCLASDPTELLYLSPGERMTCVPFFPKHYGVVGFITNHGLRFFSLRPYYTLQPLSDTLFDTPYLYNFGDSPLRATPYRLRTDGYKLQVELENDILSFKYHLGMTAANQETDWITLTIDGVPVSPATIFVLQQKQNYTLGIQANKFLSDLELTLTTPVLLQRLGEETTGSSTTFVSSLAQGERYFFNMHGKGTIQSVNPQVIGFDPLTRFLDKLGLQIRASVWGVS